MAAKRDTQSGESYDLATGFQTLIRSNDGIADAVNQMRQALVANLDMRAKFDSDPRTAQAARATRDSMQGGSDPTAGQTKGSGANGPAQTFESLRSQAAQALLNRVQPQTGRLSPGGSLGGPARDPETGTGGGWAARFAPSGNRGSGGGPGGSGGSGGHGGAGGGSGAPAGTPGGAPDAGAGGSGSHGGGGSGGGLVNGILGHVPYMNEVNKVMDEWHSQVDKTNYYRNIEGGTVGNAIGERAREEGFRFKTWGRLSEDEARQAFKGVTRIGYTNRTDQRLGTTRDEALSYITDAKTSRGQSVEEGLGQIQVASRSLAIDLGTLNKSMEAVSESAGKAGVNTEMARQQMTNLMNMGIQRGQGAGSVGFAQGIAQTNVSYGRDYASQVDSSQMYSASQEYRAAAMSNMTPGALLNLQRHDPAAALKVYGKLNDQAMASGGITPEMKDWIKAKVKAVGGADVLRNQPEIADQIGGEFLDQFLDQMPSPDAFVAVIGQLSGQNFAGNIEMAARWLVENVGGNTVSATAAKNQMQVAKTDLSGKMKDGKKNAGVSTSLDKFKELATTGGFMGMGKDRSTAADNYIAAAQKSKHRDPVIEALLQNDALKGTDGNKAQVEVQTKTGARVIPLADAIKQFPEEVAAGKVRFMNGSAAGKSVQDLTGGEVDTTRNWRKEVLKTTKAGVSTKEWDKTHERPDQGGSVKIGLTPDAARLVTAMSLGGSLGNAASQGAPPIPNSTATRSGGAWFQ